mmetsp:Transcript_18302/g.37825  ORF Transcript_18302/g.37825 Transcript_18302/m.37825 type:complete len:259 (+) Transcript_18302:298-1074(+)
MLLPFASPLKNIISSEIKVSFGVRFRLLPSPIVLTDDIDMCEVRRCAPPLTCFGTPPGQRPKTLPLVLLVPPEDADIWDGRLAAAATGAFSVVGMSAVGIGPVFSLFAELRRKDPKRPSKLPLWLPLALPPSLVPTPDATDELRRKVVSAIFWMRLANPCRFLRRCKDSTAALRIPCIFSGNPGGGSGRVVLEELADEVRLIPAFLLLPPPLLTLEFDFDDTRSEKFRAKFGSANRFRRLPSPDNAADSELALCMVAL